MSRNPSIIQGILRGLLLLAMFITRAHAAGTLGLAASASPTTLSIRDWQISDITLSYSFSSASQPGNATYIRVQLPPNLIYVSVTKTPHVSTVSVDVSNLVVIQFNDPLPAGSSGALLLQVRFLYDAPEGSSAAITGTMTSASAAAVTAAPITLTGINAVGPPPVNHGIYNGKYLYDPITIARPYLDFYISNGQSGPASDPVTNFLCEDILPPGLKLNGLSTDRWSTATAASGVTVKYITNKNSSWRQWGAGPLYSFNEAPRWIDAATIGLPAGEYVTGIRLNYGTVPGNGYLQNALVLRAGIADPFALVLQMLTGLPLTNCSDLSATGTNPVAPYATRACASQYIFPPRARFTLATGAPYTAAPSDQFQARCWLGQAPDSSKPLADPTVAFLLPAGIEYVPGGESCSYPITPTPNPPTVTVLRDAAGPGTTLVTLKWRAGSGNGYTMPATGEWTYTVMDINVRVKPGLAAGTYYIATKATWAAPADEGSDYLTNDTLDINGNGLTNDKVIESSTYVILPAPPAVPSLSSLMLVRGELDSSWSSYPATGLTVAGGRADYELTITNNGGITINDLSIIDILPAVGDTGVIDLSPRSSQWSPFLAGTVSVPAGGTVFYSSSRNPCRNDYVASGPPGCEPPGWTAIAPGDITTVRSIKLDFTGTSMLPGSEVKISWPMRAPLTAPSSGEIAWNSFGYRGTRADTNSLLLAAEPVKTGIAVQPAPLPYYGDKVWLDANANGLQDGGETGLNGIRVELFRDNGDGVSDPGTDAFLGFTVTSDGPSGSGAYRFAGMGPGSYFAVVVATDEFGISPSDAGADDTKDSDGKAGTHRRKRAAVFPVTQLAANEDDSTWDQGLTDRSGQPAVWATATLPSGSRIIGGSFAKSNSVDRKNIAAIYSNGTLDTRFNPGTGFDRSVRAVAVRSDGLIWAGGGFTAYNNTQTQGVALLNANGTLNSLTAQPDIPDISWVGMAGSNMLLAGDFGKIAGRPAGNFACLNADGSVNTAFPVSPGADGPVYSGLVSADGSIFLVGRFTTFNGFNRTGIVKLKPTGAVDEAFNPGSGADGEVYSIRRFDDGRIALTGAFRSFNSMACNNTIRLKADGVVDSTLPESNLNVRSINASQ